MDRWLLVQNDPSSSDLKGPNLLYDEPAGETIEREDVENFGIGN